AVAGEAPPAADAPAAHVPGPFALASRESLRELLDGSGFTDVHIEALDVERGHASFEELWESTLDLSRTFHDAVLSRPQEEAVEIAGALRERFLPYTRPDGSLRVPGRTLVASASA